MRNRCLLALASFAHAGLLGLLLAACSGEHGDGSHENASAPSSEAIAPITYDALFVVNGGDSSISVINTETNRLAASIRLTNASFPHHIYLSPDRSKLVLAVPGMDMSGGHAGGMHGMMGAVMLLDATTGATLRSRMTDAMNHNAAFSPDGAEVWTSQMNAPGSVLVLDSASLSTKHTIDVGDQPAEVTFTMDGSYVFVANGGSNSVTVVDAASKDVVDTLAVGRDPVGAWQGSNGVAYVDNEEDETLTAIDTRTLQVVQTVELGFMPGMAALGPDGRVWVTDAENGKVVFYSSDGVKTGEVATGPGAHAIAFDGEETMAYVSNQAEGTVSVVDVSSSVFQKSIPTGSKPNGMVWRAK